MVATIAGLCVAAEPNPLVFERLVEQLNAPSAQARDAADEALREQGPAILSLIVAARGRAVGEAAFRLRDIQRGLEEAATAEAVDEAIGTLSVAVDRVVPVGDGGTVRVMLRAQWGAALVPLAIRLPMRSIVADGPAGEAMSPTHRVAIVEPAVTPDTKSVSLPVSLAQPAPRLESLASIRGTLSLWIAGREHDFEIPLDAAGPNRLRVGHATVTLVDHSVREGVVRVTVELAYDEPTEALASHRSWLTGRLVEVVSNDGTPLHRQSQSMVARSERGGRFTAAFAMPAAAARGSNAPVDLRLRWRLPMAIHEVPFDFTVRNVPLPGPGT